MIDSPEDTIAWIAPRLPAALVSQGASRRLKAVSCVLPPARSLAFECRLAAGSPCVDLVSGITPAWGGSDLATEAATQAHGLRAGELWSNARALCSEWSDPTSLIYRKVPAVFLEFDLEGDGPVAAQPFVTCCVQPRFFEGVLTAYDGVDGGVVQQLLWRALALVGGEPAMHPQALSLCLDALPKGAAPFLVASLRARGREAVRLVLSLPTRDVPAYLARIGHPAAASENLPLLLCLRQDSSESEVYLDIGDHVLAPLGFGSPLFQSPDDFRLRILLDRLIQSGLATPEKCDAALGWLGCEDVVLEGAAWPCRFVRTLSIKVVDRPGEAPQAKVYLDLHGTFSLVD